MVAKIKIFLILGFVCFLAYFNSLDNVLISDDVEAILNKGFISSSVPLWLEPSLFLNYLNYLIGGHNPFIYHFTNILLHFATSCLVFLFLSLLFKSETAILAACLFAVHPINTEAVTWVSGKPYIISAFFILATYLFYQRANPSLSLEAKDSNNLECPILKEASAFKQFYYILSLIIFSYFGFQHLLFSVVFTLFLVLSDIALKRRRKNIKWWFPYFAIMLLILWVSRMGFFKRASFMTVDMGYYVAKNPFTYFVYSLYSHFWLLIWPARLTLFHEPIIIPQSMLDYRACLYIIPVLFLLLISFKAEKRLFLSMGIFILFLAPTYSIIPMSSLIAERYLYFPSIALSICVAFLYEKYSSKHTNFKIYFLILFILLIVSFMARTIIRNNDWDDHMVFWKQAAAISPNSWKVRDNLGFVYLLEGNAKQAVDELKQVVIMKRGSAVTFNNLGAAYTMLGNKEEAIAYFKIALEINPEYVNAYSNLGRVYMEINKNKEAEEVFKKELSINPYSASAHFYLCRIYSNQKNYNLAIDQCEEALKLGYEVPFELLEQLKQYKKY